MRVFDLLRGKRRRGGKQVGNKSQKKKSREKKKRQVGIEWGPSGHFVGRRGTGWTSADKKERKSTGAAHENSKGTHLRKFGNRGGDRSLRAKKGCFTTGEGKR